MYESVDEIWHFDLHFVVRIRDRSTEKTSDENFTAYGESAALIDPEDFLIENWEENILIHALIQQ